MASNSKLKCHLCDEVAISQDGKTLSCYHWFCKRCTDHLSKGDGTVRCPMCKGNVAIIAATVADEQHSVPVDAKHREDAEDSEPGSANTGLCHDIIYDSVAE